jgi:hypothetical protein
MTSLQIMCLVVLIEKLLIIAYLSSVPNFTFYTLHVNGKVRKEKENCTKMHKNTRYEMFLLTFDKCAE